MDNANQAREMELELIWRLKPIWNRRDTRPSHRLDALKKEMLDDQAIDSANDADNVFAPQ